MAEEKGVETGFELEERMMTGRLSSMLTMSELAGEEKLKRES